MTTTLEDDLIAAGDHAAVESQHQCLKCGRWLPAFGLTNVADNDYWPDIDYVCGRCYMDFSRERNKFIEDLARALAPPRRHDPAQIVREKRRILNETLWATATDGTVTVDEAEEWGAYRRAVAAVDPNDFQGWPEEPR